MPACPEASMLNFRQDRTPDPKDARNLAGRPNPPTPTPAAPPVAPSAARAPTPPASSTPAATSSSPTPTPTSASPVSAAAAAADPGSKLSIGVNINVKGVEISNCDVLVIEGNVEATINSKAMEISKPGRLNGTAIIDIAEIHGDFSGELTARTRLVVHATGRVTGTVHYGKLVVAEGGVISGELKQIPGTDEPVASTTASTSTSAPPPARDASPLLSPQPR
jgi:cytoskeletal protein CcmA (bactofilin family)